MRYMIQIAFRILYKVQVTMFTYEVYIVLGTFTDGLKGLLWGTGYNVYIQGIHCIRYRIQTVLGDCTWYRLQCTHTNY